MITANQCLKKYGAPELEKYMRLLPLDYPDIPALPKRIYCNEDLANPLIQALNLVVERKLFGQIKTWDGCFNIRRKRGAVSQSLHSWGIAIDINAAWNRLGKPPTMSKELVQCFKDAGFDWGGDWYRPDGMHFQLKSI